MAVRPLALALLLFAGFFDLAIAGSTGKIAGKIVDAKSKEPLVGVNVVIAGTSMGAATDIDGNYTILNIPPNTYTLKATLLGYGHVTINNVRVSLDLTTKQDFELAESAVEQNEVVIVAERPMIQKDLTAKTSVVSADQIAALPVTEVSQVISLQAGFVAGSLRGGRTGEVAYWIDGVPVTDVYDGSQVVEVNKNSIQELQVISDGPVFAIHQPDEVLARMDEWNQKQHSSSGLLARVRGAVDVEQRRRVDLGVDLRRAEAGVAQQFLKRAQIGASSEQVRRKAVAQRVRRGGRKRFRTSAQA